MKGVRAAFSLIASLAIGATPPPWPLPGRDMATPARAYTPSQRTAEGAGDLAPLSPWFSRLAAAQRSSGSRPLHILQIGDSHTAGDVITSAWRTLLQAQYGSGGRGMLAAGRPYDGYITQGMTASMSPGWSIASTFGKGSAAPHAPLGLSSYSLTSQRPGATVGLSADDAADMFDRVVICALRGPSAGQLTVDLSDGKVRLIGLRSDQFEPHCETLRTNNPSARVTVRAEGGPVTITSIGTFRDTGGIALSNVGVVGSQLVHFGRTDDAVVAEELRAYRPDLIVLAFGTNEGFTTRFEAGAYERLLISQIQRLRRLNGAAVPILLLGPPDALTQQPPLRYNADGAAVECPTVPALSLPDIASPVVVAPSNRPLLFAPPALAQVRRIQRNVAQRLGVGFWDWQGRMGGVCAARQWVNAEPPLMRRDYVHFRSAGGQIIATRLAADLAAAAR